MARILSRSLFAAGIIALFGMVPLDTDLNAQTGPPRPNVSMANFPALRSNLWPADFNGDGHTDLVAGTGDLVVRLGVGDGTFGPDRVVASAMSPVTVGDFDADSHTDIVAVGPEQDGSAELFILGGRGDGTFLTPVPIPEVTGSISTG